MSALRVLAVKPVAEARRAQVRERLVWVGGAGVLSLALTTRPFSATASWSQLALGRLIAVHGLPAAEPFSFLPSVHPWVVQGWLHDVLLAGVVGAGGPPLAAVMLGLAASGGLVLAALSVRPGMQVPGVWLAAGVLTAALVARPFLTGTVAISLLGIGAVLHILGRVDDGDTRALWLLPPLFLLWCNLDGGFAVGLAMVALAWLLHDDRPLRRRRPLLVAVVISAAATLVNPYGLGYYQALLAAAVAPAAAHLSPAFPSPDFHDGSPRLFEAVAAAVIIAWVAGGPVRRFHVTLGVAAIALALWSQQFIAVAAAVAAPQLALYGRRAWRRTLAPRLPRTARSPRFGLPPVLARVARPLAVGSALAVVAGATVVAVAAQAGPAASGAAEDRDEPRAAADHVAAVFAGQRVYAPSTWGDYLAERFPAGRVVFIYPSGGGFSDRAVASYTAVHLLEPNWETVIRDADIRVAIVDERSQEASALHELGWRVDCFDARSGAVVLAVPPPGAPMTASAPLTVPPAGAPTC